MVQAKEENDAFIHEKKRLYVQIIFFLFHSSQKSPCRSMDFTEKLKEKNEMVFLVIAWSMQVLYESDDHITIWGKPDIV